MKTAGMEL